ncbi:MAG: TonB-dependent receptor, partial [Paludibacteraceae bacterium]|nr:TonB-dependent receptor [Paludibacteraceae bacterium]
MKRQWIIGMFLAAMMPIWAAAPEGWTDSVALPDIDVSVSRVERPASQQQMQMSVIDSRLIGETQAVTPKDVSSLIPNVYMPDYGSAMTSSIYIRGLGSRINEPVMGMVIDGVPLLDKNIYDHAMQDVKRIELLQGPQGSLYGRNSPAGVMEIRTLQPLDLTTLAVHALAGYATANTVRAQASCYQPVNAKLGWGVAARYMRTDGFYTNTFDGSRVDHSQQAGGRFVLDSRPSDRWRLTATLYADWVSQGAFPYASVTTGEICYNRPGSYERLALLPSLRADYTQDGWRLQLTASYQFLHDDMHMDQDYTPADIFTLRQTQHIHGETVDALLRAPKPCEWYEWNVGLSHFFKTNAMQAPVTFMRQGIDELILGNANKGIQTVFPDDSICISNQTLL